MTTAMSTRCQRLNEQINELAEEMAREAVASSPTLWEETRGMEAVKRAITVAAVLRLPVLFIGPNAELAQMLAMQVGVSSGVFKIEPADSDNRFVMRRLSLMMKKYPMHCEAPAIPTRGVHGKTASLAAVQARIREAQSRVIKADPPAMTETAARVWNQACSELGIESDLVRRSVLQVACSCAAHNGNSTSLEVADVTEALYYWLDRR